MAGLSFDTIKYYYDNGLWDKNRVKNAVIKNVITPVQYKEITGEDYVI